MNFKFLSYLILSTIGIIIFACTSKGKSDPLKSTSEEEPVIVDLSNVKKTNTPLKLSEFAETISYIQLDDDPLLGEMKLASLHVVDDTIYVDRDNIYKYTPEGKFIRKLFIEGPGPGEGRKHSSYHAALNIKKKYFTIYDAGGNTFKSFSFNGKYLKEELVRDSLDRHLYTYFNDNLIFDYPISGFYNIGDKINILGPNLFYAKDVSTGEIVYKYPNHAADELAELRRYMYTGNGDMLFINSGEHLWFKHRHIDTIYCTDNLREISPRYIIKPQNSFIDIRKYVHFKVGDITKNEAMAIDGISGFVPLPNGGLVYGLNYGIGTVDPSGNASDWYDKPIINDLDDHLETIDLLNKFYTESFTINNDNLYFTVDAYLFFEEGSKPPFPSLTEDGNPVVVKIKLK
ncbi:MAG: 6-bladed beta-propeller [Porphyromonadaceae bacterium]|nr:6-bladed beta-propeller [Porphyromonadaceae bacterium]